ncbi:Lipoprotein-releasing system ATP-binding proteinLolD [Candidatus Methanoperedenaceae archaeon GB37]|nr:Lipoprotein-releasing system ATP-binding proteinLolD [Candidatus Methanoperedenaceae archaeon GB37]
MNNQPLLEVRNLWKSFSHKEYQIEILKGIDLKIFKGNTIAITGASGVGKSTLLHILATLERPTKGKVFYKGQDLFQLSSDALARFRNQKLGFVFQFHYLLPEFTAWENVMLPALIAGWSEKKAKEQARRLLQEVGVYHRRNHRPGELSGGEQQRVAIARALVLEPELIWADEPTGNLDQNTAEKVQSLLFSIHQKTGITMIVATHNFKTSISFCNML